MTVGEDIGKAMEQAGWRPPGEIEHITEDEAAEIVLLQRWWNSVGDTTREVLQGIATADPSVFSVATTGNAGYLSPPSGVDVETYLRAFIEGLGEKGQLPVIVPSPGPLVFDPEVPDANARFTIRWTEKNEGGPSGPFKNEISIYAVRQGATSPGPVTIDRPALAAGETRDAEYVVEGLAAGAYSVSVNLNFDPEPGSMGSASGTGSGTQGQVLVGGVDDNTPVDSLGIGVGEVSALIGAASYSEVTNADEAKAAATLMARGARRFARFAPEPWPGTLTGRAGELDALTFTNGSDFTEVRAALRQAESISSTLSFALNSAMIRNQVADANDDLVEAATTLDAALQRIVAAV